MTKRGIPLLNVLLWGLAVGWIGVLFFLSGQTAAESSELSGWLTGIVLRVLAVFDWAPANLEHLLRKAAHFCVFGVEGFLLGLAMLKTFPRRRFAAPLAFVGCALMAVANELHQAFTDGRSCEIRDMLIDSAGAALGIAFAAVLIYGIYRKRNVII